MEPLRAISRPGAISRPYSKFADQPPGPNHEARLAEAEQRIQAELDRVGGVWWETKRAKQGELFDSRT